MSHSYNAIILLVTYVVPILSMGVTYFRVGRELWGSQSIGEATSKQIESVKSKRKVSVKNGSKNEIRKDVKHDTR